MTLLDRVRSCKGRSEIRSLVATRRAEPVVVDPLWQVVVEVYPSEKDQQYLAIELDRPCAMPSGASSSTEPERNPLDDRSDLRVRSERGP